MEIIEIEERRRVQAIADTEQWSNKDGKRVEGGNIFGNCEGETKTDIRTKYECIQASWRLRGLKSRTRNK